MSLRTGGQERLRARRAPGGLLLAGGLACGAAALLAAPDAARAAAEQVWPPFVLVAGLLLVGLVAEEDGLFAAGGQLLARLAPSGLALYGGSCLLVLVVTSILNLDTSVTFLTPVLVHAARSRGERATALVVACVLLSNAGSLLLPGSNLTNLIVLGHLHLSGRDFLDRMAPAGIAAAVVTAAVIALFARHEVRATQRAAAEPIHPELAVGLVAVVAVTVLVLALRSPALPVFVVGLAATGLHALRVRRGIDSARGALGVLGLPLLVGLFGLALAAGTLGRTWSGPSTLLAHLDSAGTAAFAAVASIGLNNLPAASLLAAHRPPHPFALLLGLNIGPNAFVTGSLAWVLWIRAARGAGGRPDVRRAVVIGLVSVPFALGAALLALAATSP
jgi:arsenical pump membrane protein